MLNFIKKLFGTDKIAQPVANTPAVEFHEEIRQQVEATAPVQSFPVAKSKPIVKAKTARAKKPAVKKTTRKPQVSK